MSGRALAGLVREEREATIALLEGLEAEEWETPSLCAGWTVRAVAAHLAWAPSVTPAHTLVGLVRARGSINRFVRDSAVRWSARSREEILERLRLVMLTGAKPFGVPALAPLSDAAVHGLDMRVPLGRPRPIPPETFRRLADWHARLTWPGTVLVGGDVAARIGGVRLVCDEVGWTHGDGPDVHGSTEAMLLLLAGRPVGRGRLSGPGVEVLRPRL